MRFLIVNAGYPQRAEVAIFVLKQRKKYIHHFSLEGQQVKQHEGAN